VKKDHTLSYPALEVGREEHSIGRIYICIGGVSLSDTSSYNIGGNTWFRFGTLRSDGQHEMREMNVA
jgi:hypothetical protein